MEKSLVESLEFKNVYQFTATEGMEDINFNLGEASYSLRTAKLNDVHTPIRVYHDMEKRCVYCKQVDNGSSCEVLEGYIDEMFSKLIKTPSIRLNWLFIEHDGDI